MTPVELTEAAKKLADAKEADVYAINSGIDFETAEQCIEFVRCNPSRRKNAILVLATNGGSPDDGYRLARCLAREYENFTALILGQCKSAGTLVCLGATEIAMGDLGELGPLDVQIGKEDELTRMSGLIYDQAMSAISEKSFSAWERTFINLKTRSQGNISTKTAAQIATKITCGLFSEITGQIDPQRLGELTRACNIAIEYGGRLHKDKKAVVKLTHRFPHHGFVIDREDASEFLKTVRDLDEAEFEFEQTAGEFFRAQIESKHIVALLYPNPYEQDSKKESPTPDTQPIPKAAEHEPKNGSTGEQGGAPKTTATAQLGRGPQRRPAARKLIRTRR